MASSAPSVVGEGRVASAGGAAVKDPLTALIFSTGCCVLGVVFVFASG